MINYASILLSYLHTGKVLNNVKPINEIKKDVAAACFAETNKKDMGMNVYRHKSTHIFTHIQTNTSGKNT